jgi:hypothetical protein
MSTPNQSHYNIFQLHKLYAEHCIEAVWLLSFSEWCDVLAKEDNLISQPPFTNCRVVRRIDPKLPFQLDNCYCSLSQERPNYYREDWVMIPGRGYEFKGFTKRL